MRKMVTWLIGLILALDLALLSLFGKTYTKLLIIKPFLYAHDLVLFIMVLLCVPYFKFTKRVKSVELLFIMAILYLLYAFYSLGFESSYVILRQFMLFGYGICVYIIINKLFSAETIKNNFILYLIYFGISCFIIQVLFILYTLWFLNYNPFFQRNYFSPIIVFGFFVSASYVLTYIKAKYLKHFLYVLIFLISLTTGHDSTYLSLVLLYFTYLFVNFELKYKVILVSGLLLLVIGVFVFIPSFSDVNMQWRLLFWKESFLRSANNYFIFGDGFGMQYASDKTILKLNNVYFEFLNPPIFRGDDKYFSAPHNSFISMVLHLGILSLVLLFYPFKSLFLNKSLIMDKEVLFLSLCLLGFVAFSSFNVILELPHASSIFWIVFFGLIFKSSEKGEIPTN